MPAPSTVDILNRLYVLHCRSLPMYLSYAQPHELQNRPEAAAVLEQVVADQKRMSDRLATLILDSSGTIDPGEFPMSFTGLHDLSVNYLLKMVVDRQKKHIVACEKLAEALAMAPFAQAVAREAVGEAKGHLDNLLELTEKAAA